MNTRKFVSFIVITAFTMFGAVKIAPTVVLAAPSPDGSNGVEVTTPIPDSSNTPGPSSILPNSQGLTTPDSGSIIPGTQGTNTPDSGAILPNTQGTNGSDSGAILPNTQGSNGYESSITAPTAYSITTSIIGDAYSGTITCDGTTCSSYPAGTTVILAATANDGYTFSDWSASTGFTPECTGTGTCSITLAANSSVSATFTANTKESVASVSSFSGGGGSYSSSGSGGFVPLALKTTLATTTTSCPLITSYMQFGANNNGAQVALLQAFLKNSQNLAVDVTGTFDQKTLAAVRAFQTKYLADTMGPWGATQSSGYVYITTTKKINEIACNSPLTLSAADMVIINAYKNAQTVGTAGTATPATLNASTTPLGPQVGVNTTTGGNANTAAVGNSANTASVVNASVLQRLWSWIKGLFGH